MSQIKKIIRQILNKIKWLLKNKKDFFQKILNIFYNHLN
jgi:hypothetical protein